MGVIFRILMTISAILYVVVIFLIKEGIFISDIICKSGYSFSPHISYVAYMLLPILVTYIFLKFTKFLPKDYVKEKSINSVESADSSFLPAYLGYFFVALSIPGDNQVVWYILTLLFVFAFTSQNIYYNPMLLLFGYKFYYLTNSDKVRILVATKVGLKIPEDIEFEKLRRINNNTFIDG